MNAGEREGPDTPQQIANRIGLWRDLILNPSGDPCGPSLGSLLDTFEADVRAHERNSLQALLDALEVAQWKIAAVERLAYELESSVEYEVGGTPATLRDWDLLTRARDIRAALAAEDTAGSAS